MDVTWHIADDEIKRLPYNTMLLVRTAIAFRITMAGYIDYENWSWRDNSTDEIVKYWARFEEPMLDIH